MKRWKILAWTLFTSCSLSLPSAVLAYGPVDCVRDAAQADKDMLMRLAVELCAGASSPAVSQCYRDALKVDSGMLRRHAIDLCAGSTNAKNTLDCYRKASRLGLFRSHATTLCSARNAPFP